MLQRLSSALGKLLSWLANLFEERTKSIYSVGIHRSNRGSSRLLAPCLLEGIHPPRPRERAWLMRHPPPRWGWPLHCHCQVTAITASWQFHYMLMAAPFIGFPFLRLHVGYKGISVKYLATHQISHRCANTHTHPEKSHCSQDSEVSLLAKKPLHTAQGYTSVPQKLLWKKGLWKLSKPRRWWQGGHLVETEREAVFQLNAYIFCHCLARWWHSSNANIFIFEFYTMYI